MKVINSRFHSLLEDWRWLEAWRWLLEAWGWLLGAFGLLAALLLIKTFSKVSDTVSETVLEKAASVHRSFVKEDTHVIKVLRSLAKKALGVLWPLSYIKVLIMIVVVAGTLLVYAFLQQVQEDVSQNKDMLQQVQKDVSQNKDMLQQVQKDVSRQKEMAVSQKEQKKELRSLKRELRSQEREKKRQDRKDDRKDEKQQRELRSLEKRVEQLEESEWNR